MPVVDCVVPYNDIFDLFCNMGVACGPRYPLILLQALATLAGIRYYR